MQQHGHKGEPVPDPRGEADVVEAKGREPRLQQPGLPEHLSVRALRGVRRGLERLLPHLGRAIGPFGANAGTAIIL